MEAAKIIELLSYTLPAIITGLVAFYFFNLHTKNEEGRRRYLLQKEAQKSALPLRLQAYERMTLFVERISLSKLLIRIAPLSNDKKEYEKYLITQVEQEFEHNLTQQIYMSEECWNVITTTKNATIQIIRKGALNEKAIDAYSMREVLLSDLLDKQSPTAAALSYIKNDVHGLW